METYMGWMEMMTAGHVSHSHREQLLLEAALSVNVDPRL